LLYFSGMKSGIIAIDKPVDFTSADALRVIKRRFGFKRIGHAGTLDPKASGALIVLVEEARKLSACFMESEKVYTAYGRLGEISNTCDSEGEITVVKENPGVSESELKEALASFLGESLQTPPIYSAKKINGKNAYTLARKGETFELAASAIFVNSIELIGFDGKNFSFAVRCSPGTYIRSLCADIGAKLSVGAYLTGLRRTECGGFREKELRTLADLETISADEAVVPISPGILRLPYFMALKCEYKKALDGSKIAISPGRIQRTDLLRGEDPICACYTDETTCVGIFSIESSLESTVAVELHPRRMLLCEP